MKLVQYKEQPQAFEAAGIQLPKYDREAVRKNTYENPIWVHFGAGNIFRAYVAHLQQILLNEGLSDRGIIAAESFDEEILDRAYKPYDELSLLSILKADGTCEHEVIGSVTESLKAVPYKADWDRLIDIMRSPSLQMLSFTVTEKGYGDTRDESLMGCLTRLLMERYLKGQMPVAVVSMDNCSHNGEKLQKGVLTVAERWVGADVVDAGFLEYLQDPSVCSFPWSMIDKITPRPDQAVKEMLEGIGFEDTEIIITEKHSYTAPFVNAEQAEYLVIEDAFPNGRPALEKAGVYFTDREHVNRVERMKVCTCLNPLHTALAIFGCILGKKTIFEEMADPDLKDLVYHLGYKEGMPVVTDPEILSPMQFIEDVLTLRLPNPFMPDTPQRIATDTSQKLAIRFGETIKATEDPTTLQVIPLVLAGWLRYLTAVGDDGEPFELSPDPLMDEVKNMAPEEILTREDIFGTDLEKVGLKDQILTSFRNMQQGPGAVRAEIVRVLNQCGAR